MKKKPLCGVVAGVVVIIVVTILADIVLHATRLFPPRGRPISDALALQATAYRIVISVWGDWLTARFAPDRPPKHDILPGCVGVVLGLVGVVPAWNRGLRPRRYATSLAVLAIPQCWAGGRIFGMQSNER